MDTQTLKPDIGEIKKAATILCNGLTELRILQGKKVLSGYYTDYERLAQDAAAQNPRADGVYLIPNTVQYDLFARAANRLKEFGSTTADKDIVSRRWIPIDLDPKRPTGISSTDQEHEAAIQLAYAVRDWFKGFGVPREAIVIGDSGNGAHVLIRLEDLPNNETTTDLVKKILLVLADNLNDDIVSVDLTTFNAARIWKLYGTVARKGDSTPERPHRVSRLLEIPETLIPAPVSILESIVAQLAPTPIKEVPRTSTKSTFNLETWMQEHGLSVKRREPYQGGTRYILEACPFNPEHTGTAAAVIQAASGAIGFKCQHNSCADRSWADVRELKEPGYKVKKANRDNIDSFYYDPSNSLNLTDAGNARYFNQLYEDRLRYDHRRGRWLEWNVNYWREDDDGQVMRLALKADRDRYKEAISIPDLKERERVVKWIINSEQRARLEAVIAIAKNLKPISDSGDRWDSDPWLMCVANGIIDLRTGELRPGRQADLVTIMSNTVYNPEAKPARWIQFLNEVFDGDNSLITYLQKYFGYCLTGQTNEQVCLIGYGLGSNGKGRLSSILRHIMGDYSYNAPFSTFELNNRAAIPNDMAALVGKRLVTSSETIEGTRLNESRLKALVGEDPITARFLHCEFFTFTPACKLFLTVNHRPRVQDDSYGFWRKVRLVPFNRQFKGKDNDKDLLAKLINESSGILTWLVEGCLKWQKEGLEPTPKAITKATAEYEFESDPLSEFIQDDCAINPQAQVAAITFYKQYKEWCQSQGMKESEILTNTAFGRKVSSKFKKVRGHNGAVYQGIGTKRDGFVTGFESNDNENNVNDNFEISCGNKLENPSKPVTTLKEPVTPQNDPDLEF